MAEGEITVALKAILYRPDGTFLALRRSASAPIKPLAWDLPGGRIQMGEETEDGVIREIKEETGLSVENLRLLHVIARNSSSGQFWVTICYTARPSSEEVRLSFEHCDSRWVTPEEFKALAASSRLKAFVERFASDTIRS